MRIASTVAARAAGRRREDEPVDVDARVETGTGPNQMVGGAQREGRVARREREPASCIGDGTAQLHRDRLAVDAQEVGATCVPDLPRRGRAGRTRDRNLRERDRRSGCARVRRARRPARLDDEAQPLGGHRAEPHGHGRGRALGGPIGDRRQVHTGDVHAVGLDADPRRHGVARVGDDREVDMVDRLRRWAGHLDPRTGRGPDRRGPRGGGVAVERTRRTGLDIPREVARRRERRARRVRPEDSVDHVVRCVRIDARGPGHGERAGLRQRDRARHRELLVLARAVGGIDALAGEHDAQ